MPGTARCGNGRRTSLTSGPDVKTPRRTETTASPRRNPHGPAPRRTLEVVEFDNDAEFVELDASKARTPEGTLMHIKPLTTPAAPAGIPDTKPTGQKRSLERGKATHKKNPGKRAKSGG
jgi:hypothetical protein